MPSKMSKVSFVTSGMEKMGKKVEDFILFFPLGVMYLEL